MWSHTVPPPELTLAPHGRMSVPISISNPDLARHSTELFMDSGFCPTSQRMGVMVAFRRFEDFTRWGCRDMPGQACVCVFWVPLQLFKSKMGWKGHSWEQLGSARGSSSSHHSCRLDILSLALTLWGHEVAFGDM